MFVSVMTSVFFNVQNHFKCRGRCRAIKSKYPLYYS